MILGMTPGDLFRAPEEVLATRMRYVRDEFGDIVHEIEQSGAKLNRQHFRDERGNLVLQVDGTVGETPEKIGAVRAEKHYTYAPGTNAVIETQAWSEGRTPSRYAEYTVEGSRTWEYFTYDSRGRVSDIIEIHEERLPWPDGLTEEVQAYIEEELDRRVPPLTPLVPSSSALSEWRVERDVARGWFRTFHDENPDGLLALWATRTTLEYRPDGSLGLVKLETLIAEDGELPKLVAWRQPFGLRWHELGGTVLRHDHDGRVLSRRQYTVSKPGRPGRPAVWRPTGERELVPWNELVRGVSSAPLFEETRSQTRVRVYFGEAVGAELDHRGHLVEAFVELPGVGDRLVAWWRGEYWPAGRAEPLGEDTGRLLYYVHDVTGRLLHRVDEQGRRVFRAGELDVPALIPAAVETPLDEGDIWDHVRSMDPLDMIQLGLDIGGLTPGLGEPLDVINGAISIARGNYLDAALSVAAAIPVAGTAAVLGKWARKTARGSKLLRTRRAVGVARAFDGPYVGRIWSWRKAEGYRGPVKELFNDGTGAFSPWRLKDSADPSRPVRFLRNRAVPTVRAMHNNNSSTLSSIVEKINEPEWKDKIRIFGKLSIREGKVTLYEGATFGTYIEEMVHLVQFHSQRPGFLSPLFRSNQQKLMKWWKETTGRRDWRRELFELDAWYFMKEELGFTGKEAPSLLNVQEAKFIVKQAETWKPEIDMVIIFPP